MRLAATHFVEVYESVNKVETVSKLYPINAMAKCLYISRAMKFKTLQVWKIKFKENANPEKRELPESKK